MRHSFCLKELNTYKENFQIECYLGFSKNIYVFGCPWSQLQHVESSSLLFLTAIFKASSDNHFAFLHFFFLGMVLTTASCTISGTSVHILQALCLSDLIP